MHIGYSEIRKDPKMLSRRSLLKLWKMNTRLEEYESVEALAATMIKNYCIDQIRKQKYIESGNKSTLAAYRDSEPSPHGEG